MKNQYRREHMKNFIITLLFISLLALTLFNWLYDREDITLFAGTNIMETAALPVPIQEPARPVLTLITRGGVSYAAGNGDFAVSVIYERFRMLFAEALASASGRRPVTRAAWDAVLKQDCVFFEFLDCVPVWALAESISFDAAPEVDDLPLKSFILCADGLFIFTGESYFRFDILLDIVIPENLEDALFKAAFVNNAIVTERDSDYPAAVLSNRFMEEPYLSEILSVMGFNPNTKFRYTQADGEVVFIDEQRTLHVSPSGKITYNDATVYASEPFDSREAVRICLNAIPSGAAFWGEGRLMLGNTSAIDGGVSVEFNYALNGALFLERGSVFVVKGSRITEASIQLCPAVASGEPADLMPQRQAALLLDEDKELSLCYSEGADGVWLPQWYSR